MSHGPTAIPCLRGRLAPAGKRIARLLGAIELALQVRRERRFLLAMDDRMLKDLGLNGIAYAEASRPFWDVPAERWRSHKPCTGAQQR